MKGNKYLDEKFMLETIEKAKEGIKKGQAPFAACIVDELNNIVVCEHSKVWETNDITAHAEIVAIRKACEKLGKIDLSNCTIYSTTEPCPMCFSAIHWAGIERIVFAANIGDAKNAGFRELMISNEKMNEIGGGRIEIKKEFKRGEALKLFEEWGKGEGKKNY
ncbi:MAG: nucleoside deaminase [Candidatus Micrarchaeota archaeon]